MLSLGAELLSHACRGNMVAKFHTVNLGGPSLENYFYGEVEKERESLSM